jgi:hypothetical protein
MPITAGVCVLYLLRYDVPSRRPDSNQHRP